MRFVLDHNVDARVATFLRRAGHEAWLASQAGLAVAADDEITVYANDRNAMVVSHDREFSQRRRRNTIGRHLWLKCDEPDAVELLSQHLQRVVQLAAEFHDCLITLSHEGMVMSTQWS